MSLACTTSTPTSFSNGVSNSRKGLSRRSPPVRMLFQPPSWLLPSSRSESYNVCSGRRPWRTRSSKTPWSMVEQKMDCACALVAGGRRLSAVSQALNVSRAQLSVRVHRKPGWQDGRHHRQRELGRIMEAMAELPSYGYRRVWALLRRQSEATRQPAVNAKRVYRVMRDHGLLLERKPAAPLTQRAHKGRVAVKESNRRWCSDGFEFRCDNGEKLRVTFAMDCCDRETLDWAASTGGYDSDTVQDVMLRSVERRFGDSLPASPVEWLTDNGSAYRAHETRAFAREIGLEPRTTAVRSPQSNGIAESFVKTMKRDYIEMMPKPDSRTAVGNLAIAFEHYNEHHPHSALGYRSPREFLRSRVSQP